MQPPSPFALAGDNHLARIPPVAGDIQRCTGIRWQGTQPGGLGLQQRPGRLADDDLLFASDMASDRDDLARRIRLERQREMKPRLQPGFAAKNRKAGLARRGEFG